MEIWLTEGSDPSPILGDIDRLAREARVPVRLVSQRRLESVQGTDAPQGVVAFAEPLSAASLDELVLGWSEGSGAGEGSEPGYDVALDGPEEDDADEDDADEVDGFFIELGEIEGAEDADPAFFVDFVLQEDDEADLEDGEASPETSDETGETGTPETGITGLGGVSDPTEETAEDVAAEDLLNGAHSESDTGVQVASVERARAGASAKPPVSDDSRAPAFLVLLEGCTDPQNLGAILRSAECAGATGVAVPRHRSVHVTPAVTKAAAGAIEHLQMALVSGMPSALQALGRLGVMTVGLDERGTSSLYDLDLGRLPVALVLGSEGTGLSPLARRRCDVLCRIPVGGEIPSLNVSAAAAVACFEVARQRASRHD